MTKQAFLEQNLKAGEIYAGLILGTNGAPDYHLFLLAAKPADKLNWADAMKWAASVGGDLPTRQEQSLLFANTKDQFEACYYWSNTPHADNADCAWVQNFNNGTKFTFHKSNEYRARAVRRVLIIQ
jgi:hypothetical protein